MPVFSLSDDAINISQMPPSESSAVVMQTFPNEAPLQRNIDRMVSGHDGALTDAQRAIATEIYNAFQALPVENGARIARGEARLVRLSNGTNIIFASTFFDRNETAALTTANLISDNIIAAELAVQEATTNALRLAQENGITDVTFPTMRSNNIGRGQNILTGEISGAAMERGRAASGFTGEATVRLFGGATPDNTAFVRAVNQSLPPLIEIDTTRPIPSRGDFFLTDAANAERVQAVIDRYFSDRGQPMTHQIVERNGRQYAVFYLTDEGNELVGRMRREISGYFAETLAREAGVQNVEFFVGDPASPQTLTNAIEFRDQIVNLGAPPADVVNAAAEFGGRTYFVLLPEDVAHAKELIRENSPTAIINKARNPVPFGREISGFHEIHVVVNGQTLVYLGSADPEFRFGGTESDLLREAGIPNSNTYGENVSDPLEFNRRRYGHLQEILATHPQGFSYLENARSGAANDAPTIARYPDNPIQAVESQNSVIGNNDLAASLDEQARILDHSMSRPNRLGSRFAIGRDPINPHIVRMQDRALGDSIQQDWNVRPEDIAARGDLSVATLDGTVMRMGADGQYINPYLTETGQTGGGFLGVSRTSSGSVSAESRATDVVLSFIDDAGQLRFVAVRRNDTGQLAFTGGFNDGSALDTATREFIEESISGSVTEHMPPELRAAVNRVAELRRIGNYHPDQLTDGERAVLSQHGMDPARFSGDMGEAAYRFLQTTDPQYIADIRAYIEDGIRVAYQGPVRADPRVTNSRFVSTTVYSRLIDRADLDEINSRNGRQYRFSAGSDAADVDTPLFGAEFAREAYASHGPLQMMVAADLLRNEALPETAVSQLQGMSETLDTALVQEGIMARMSPADITAHYPTIAAELFTARVEGLAVDHVMRVTGRFLPADHPLRQLSRVGERMVSASASGEALRLSTGEMGALLDPELAYRSAAEFIQLHGPMFAEELRQIDPSMTPERLVSLLNQSADHAAASGRLTQMAGDLRTTLPEAAAVVDTEQAPMRARLAADIASVIHPAQVADLPRITVRNASHRALFQYNLDLSGELFRPNPETVTNRFGRQVRSGITGYLEQTGTEADGKPVYQALIFEDAQANPQRIAAVEYYNPRISGVQRFPVENGVLILPANTLDQVADISTQIGGIAENNTRITPEQLDTVLRSSLNWYNDNGLTPDIYNSDTTAFAFDPATGNFDGHERVQPGVYRRASSMEIVVLESPNGRPVAFDPGVPYMGTMLGRSGRLVVRWDGREWMPLDEEYVASSLRQNALTIPAGTSPENVALIEARINRLSGGQGADALSTRSDNNQVQAVLDYAKNELGVTIEYNPFGNEIFDAARTNPVNVQTLAAQSPIAIPVADTSVLTQADLRGRFVGVVVPAEGGDANAILNVLTENRNVLVAPENSFFTAPAETQQFLDNNPPRIYRLDDGTLVVGFNDVPPNMSNVMDDGLLQLQLNRAFEGIPISEANSSAVINYAPNMALLYEPVIIPGDAANPLTQRDLRDGFVGLLVDEDGDVSAALRDLHSDISDIIHYNADEARAIEVDRFLENNPPRAYLLENGRTVIGYAEVPEPLRAALSEAMDEIPLLGSSIEDVSPLRTTSVAGILAEAGVVAPVEASLRPLALNGDQVLSDIRSQVIADATIPTTMRRPDVRMVIRNNTTEPVQFRNPGGHGTTAETIPPAGTLNGSGQPRDAAQVMFRGGTVDEQLANARAVDERYGLSERGFTTEFLADLEAGRVPEIREIYGPSGFEEQSGALLRDPATYDGQSVPEASRGDNASYGARGKVIDGVLQPTAETIVRIRVPVDVAATLAGTDSVAERSYVAADGNRYIVMGVSSDWQTGATNTRPIAPAIAREFYGAALDVAPVVDIDAEGRIVSTDGLPRANALQLAAHQFTQGPTTRFRVMTNDTGLPIAILDTQTSTVHRIPGYPTLHDTIAAPAGSAMVPARSFATTPPLPADATIAFTVETDAGQLRYSDVTVSVGGDSNLGTIRNAAFDGTGRVLVAGQPLPLAADLVSPRVADTSPSPFTGEGWAELADQQTPTDLFPVDVRPIGGVVDGSVAPSTTTDARIFSPAALTEILRGTQLTTRTNASGAEVFEVIFPENMDATARGQMVSDISRSGVDPRGVSFNGDRVTIPVTDLNRGTLASVLEHSARVPSGFVPSARGASIGAGAVGLAFVPLQYATTYQLDRAAGGAQLAYGTASMAANATGGIAGATEAAAWIRAGRTGIPSTGVLRTVGNAAIPLVLAATASEMGAAYESGSGGRGAAAAGGAVGGIAGGIAGGAMFGPWGAAIGGIGAGLGGAVLSADAFGDDVQRWFVGMRHDEALAAINRISALRTATRGLSGEALHEQVRLRLSRDQGPRRARIPSEEEIQSNMALATHATWSEFMADVDISSRTGVMQPITQRLITRGYTLEEIRNLTARAPREDVAITPVSLAIPGLPNAFALPTTGELTAYRGRLNDRYGSAVVQRAIDLEGRALQQRANERRPNISENALATEHGQQFFDRVFEYQYRFQMGAGVDRATIIRALTDSNLQREAGFSEEEIQRLSANQENVYVIPVGTRESTALTRRLFDMMRVGVFDEGTGATYRQVGNNYVINMSRIHDSLYPEVRQMMKEFARNNPEQVTVVKNDPPQPIRELRNMEFFNPEYAPRLTLPAGQDFVRLLSASGVDVTNIRDVTGETAMFASIAPDARSVLGASVSEDWRINPAYALQINRQIGRESVGTTVDAQTVNVFRTTILGSTPTNRDEQRWQEFLRVGPASEQGQRLIADAMRDHRNAELLGNREFVMQLQRMASVADRELPIDGDYGPRTRAALEVLTDNQWDEIQAAGLGTEESGQMLQRGVQRTLSRHVQIMAGIPEADQDGIIGRRTRGALQTLLGDRYEEARRAGFTSETGYGIIAEAYVAQQSALQVQQLEVQQSGALLAGLDSAQTATLVADIQSIASALSNVTYLDTAARTVPAILADSNLEAADIEIVLQYLRDNPSILGDRTLETLSDDGNAALTLGDLQAAITRIREQSSRENNIQ